MRVKLLLVVVTLFRQAKSKAAVHSLKAIYTQLRPNNVEQRRRNVDESILFLTCFVIFPLINYFSYIYIYLS